MSDQPIESMHSDVAVQLLREISLSNKEIRDDVRALSTTITQVQISQVRTESRVDALERFREDVEESATKAADERREAWTQRVTGFITAGVSGAIGYLISFLKTGTPPTHH